MMRTSMWAAAFSLALIGAVSGCRSTTPPVTYYTISPISMLSIDRGVQEDPAIVIGVRPVDLPGYINRTQMVTRRGANQLAISTLNRWVDYPDRLVQQMIGENLQVLMPDTRVVNAPWPMALKPDVTVTVKFLELIGTNNQVLLSAVWVVDHADPASAVRTLRMNLAEPITGEGFDELAAAHSRVLATLCRKIADSLKKEGD